MKLVELLDKHKPARVNLVFYHGIGDCIMFLPTAKRLMILYPSISFNILTLTGQEKLFKYFGIPAESLKGDIVDGIVNDVLTKTIRFDMSSPPVTKNEHCCLEEIGIENVPEPLQKLRTNNSKLVGFSFQNTCLPGYANPSEEYCRQLWNITKDAGFLPIEIHFLHQYANPVNKRYQFVDLSTREMACSIENLLLTISACRKFIGVSSGPYFCAVQLLGYNNVCFLEKDSRLVEAYRSSLPKIRVKHDDPSTLLEFLTYSD